MDNLEAHARKFEHFETPVWAIEAALNKIMLGGNVVDSGCGTGILSRAVAARKNSRVTSFDIHHWGYAPTIISDYLKLTKDTIDLTVGDNFDVVMNPPFSKATDFVEQSFKLGADRVLCFQRFSWRGSKRRKRFFEKYPPVEVWLCGDRATCWRHDIPLNEREGFKNPATGKKRSGSSTDHAFFVFDRGYQGKTDLKILFKTDAKAE